MKIGPFKPHHGKRWLLWYFHDEYPFDWLFLTFSYYKLMDPLSIALVSDFYLPDLGGVELQIK